ncbi:hypothetical protein BDP27DRAFT_1425094 [Rhodocollybia butyracea]|uniref:Uncharacterized protein n=1 Tax=Rhodocollybia butyracea TaxID=206335 RepID=A0A9P5PMC2_9AGAR|nr:hypothetical protein BDP27DRAFT_1425094 [Rhodocollybia butyracea]
MTSYTLRPDATLYATGFVVTEAHIKKMAARLCPPNTLQYCRSVTALQVYVAPLRFAILRLGPPKLDDTRYLFIINFIPGLKGSKRSFRWRDKVKKQWWEMFGKFGDDPSLEDPESLTIPYPTNISLPVFLTELLQITLMARPELHEFLIPVKKKPS